MEKWGRRGDAKMNPSEKISGGAWRDNTIKLVAHLAPSSRHENLKWYFV